MKIPIFNTLFLNSDRKLETNKVDLDILNNLNLNNVNSKRFPMIKLLDFLPDNHSLYETVIVAANDKFVELFLNNKIKFTDIQKNLFKIIKKNEFQKFKKISPKNITDITNLNDYVRLKIAKNNI
jgi:1-deoxy-D-xylulose-5-phosphate reductoisomerase